MDKLNKKYVRSPQENLLLISGSGRNCGKTSLACHVIRQVSKTTRVVGLKISPHFHQLSNKQELLLSNDNFKIFRETDSTTAKDSSRMLMAGAHDSIYLQCEDSYLTIAWEELCKLLPPGIAIVCESGSFGKYFKPGLHLLVESINPDKMKRSYQQNKKLADRIVRFDGAHFNVDVEEVEFVKNTWKLNKKQDDQIRRRA